MTATYDPQQQARPNAQWRGLWRPSAWRSLPDRPQQGWLHLVGIVALGLYANVVINEVQSPLWYVPFNLALVGIFILLARLGGATWTALGMQPEQLRRGLLIGGAISVGVVLTVAIAVAIPAFRVVFRDERIVEGSVGLSVYHAAFRVPLGTALYEEVLFRGVLFGLIASRTTVLAAAVWSSALFGLWHVLPAIDAIRTNPLGESLSSPDVAVIAGAVIVTFLAGIVFVWIRLFAGSIIAPILVHAAINSTMIIASSVVVFML